jgi:hypothetical protein
MTLPGYAAGRVKQGLYPLPGSGQEISWTATRGQMPGRPEMLDRQAVLHMI